MLDEIVFLPLLCLVGLIHMTGVVEADIVYFRYTRLSVLSWAAEVCSGSQNLTNRHYQNYCYEQAASF